MGKGGRIRIPDSRRIFSIMAAGLSSVSRYHQEHSRPQVAEQVQRAAEASGELQSEPGPRS